MTEKKIRKPYRPGPVDLRRVHRLLANTTRGKWRVGWFDGAGRIIVETGPEDEPTWIGQDFTVGDANFIAESNEIVAAMAMELRELRDRLLDTERLLTYTHAKVDRVQAISDEWNSHAPKYSMHVGLAGRRLQEAIDGPDSRK